MPSRADGRRVAEWVLRGAMVVALVVSLWRVLHEDVTSAAGRVASSRDLAKPMSEAITNPAVSRISVKVDSTLSRSDRDMLAALARSGVAVHWSGNAPTLALEVLRQRDPSSAGRMLVLGGDRTVVADSAGVLDTVRAASGATMESETVVGSVRASTGTFAARAEAPAPIIPRAVLVLGRAGWEAKFVIAALTESGWIVRASLPASPTVTVRDAGVLPIDTSRYDVVVALDSSAADVAPAIAKFVVQGGGLVAGAGALSLDALRGVAPAAASARVPGRILLAEDSVTPKDLPISALVSLRREALPLARERPGIALAARRAGAGRVLAIGYDESWRWRMLGGSTGLAMHRTWWSHAAASVAPERGAASEIDNSDAAPRAALIDALGEPSTDATRDTAPPGQPLPIAILAAIALLLLAEVASRRFRGVR